MANVSAAVMAAVKRKLNVTWDDETTNARLEDVVATVSPRLSSLLGYESSYEFTSADGNAWGLFLNGCLYEFSDALDDFWDNYAPDIAAAHWENAIGEAISDGEATSDA